MTLGQVSKLVTEHLSSPNAIQLRAQNDKAALGQMAKTMLGGIVLFVIGLAMLGFGKSGVLGAFGLIFVLAAVIVLAYAVLSPMWKPGITFESKNSKGRTTDGLASRAYFPEQRDPVSMPGVTEHTTELLVEHNVGSNKDSGEIVSSTH